MPAICNSCCAMPALRNLSFTWRVVLRLEPPSTTPMKTSREPSLPQQNCWSGCGWQRAPRGWSSVSSAAVYGAGHTGPIREEQALLPFSPYGYHKLMMENVCRSYAANYGLAVTVVRLFSVYGSWLKKQVLWDMCSRLASGTRQLVLGGTGEELRDWTDIRDVVRALEFTMGLATDPDAMAIFNVGSGQGTSVGSIAAMVLESWPAPTKVIFNGKARPGNPCSLVADGWFLQKNGFAWSIPVRSGVRDYVRWYLQSSRR